MDGSAFCFSFAELLRSNYFVIIFNYVQVCMSAYGYEHMSTGAYGSQNMVVDTMRLELQRVISH